MVNTITLVDTDFDERVASWVFTRRCGYVVTSPGNLVISRAGRDELVGTAESSAVRCVERFIGLLGYWATLGSLDTQRIIFGILFKQM